MPWRFVPAGILAIIGGLSLLLGSLGIAASWVAAVGAVSGFLLSAMTVLLVWIRDGQKDLLQLRRSLRRVNRRVLELQGSVAAMSAAAVPPERSPGPESQVVPTGEAPAFHYKYGEYLRVVTRVRDDLSVAHPLWDIEDKLKGYRFADRHGVDRPRVLGTYPSIGMVRWDALPEDFVVKPQRGSSNMGVLALVRTPDQGFWDVMRAKAWTIEQICAYQDGLSASGRVSKAVFVEELLWDPRGHRTVPWDWKCLCLGGSVELLMQRDLREAARSADWRFNFWDRNFRELGSIKGVDRFDPSLPPPHDPTGLVAFAENVAQLVRLPLLRVDVFETTRGVVLGEFTPLPGGQNYSPEIDAVLGEAWERAEVGRVADEIRAGRWDHLKVSDDELELVCRDAAPIAVTGRTCDDTAR